MLERSLKSSRQSRDAQIMFEKSVESAPSKVHPVWRSQFPLDVEDFGKLSREKLNNYLLLLSVIEQNLVEYTNIKKELAKVLEEVKACNVKEETDDFGYEVDIDDDEDYAERLDENGNVVNPDDFVGNSADAPRASTGPVDQGDVLTMLLKGKN